MSEWPRPYHPIVDNSVDYQRTALLYPLQPGGADDLAAWAGGTVAIVNGGPAVLLPAGGGVVGLGDVAVRDGDRPAYAVPGGEISARFWPVGTDETPPVA